ncbi:hypothetical protein BDB00DRAFT_808063 [Zychaea mexicana]|uniref:uncharacterized protein n=1 Tax=Zychaea mexicana TaxID=64656 RepID=UPI0022FEFF95|nr:uncharacterized protein BDB00DRAFT_808063 [Zychaea mexicana]KAI9496620.1 hypothetical protein BDB00DRAFT_808063 [Zychaea mexicana]
MPNGCMWLAQPSPPKFNNAYAQQQRHRLLDLPKELLLEIVSNVAVSPNEIYPISLLELSKTCRYLHHLIHKDPWRQAILWPRAFAARFDTQAIYRRQLQHDLDWQRAFEQRYKTLATCRRVADRLLIAQQQHQHRLQTAAVARDLTGRLLGNIDWKTIWCMVTEHDELNVPLLLNHQVHLLAGAAFQLGAYRDREVYPVVLPILSLLVNYDFTVTRFFTSEVSPHIVSQELSQFAYDFEADALITKHMSPRLFHSELDRQQRQQQQHDNGIISHHTKWNTHDNEDDGDHGEHDAVLSILPPPGAFYPAQDPLTSAFHLFFTTVFACHPAPYQDIPNCSPIPLFPLNSTMFDVEFLRRYERELFLASLRESRDAWHEKQQHKAETTAITTTTAESSSSERRENIFSSTGFASSTHYVSEAHLIEGEWMGYYSFLDIDDDGDDDEDDDNREYDNNNRNRNIDNNGNQPPPQHHQLPMTAASTATPSTASDWFDGPMRLTLRIVPLEDEALSPWHHNNHANEPNTKASFPSCHLRTCPLTRFEGNGIDNLGAFHVSGLIDDTEDGQVTWEKTYLDSDETWEYAGRFILPMGLCGRWGDEQYGGPWWIWKVNDDQAAPPVASTAK